MMGSARYCQIVHLPVFMINLTEKSRFIYGWCLILCVLSRFWQHILRQVTKIHEGVVEE